MLTDRIVLLEYDVPGPVVIHERWVLEHVTGNNYVVATHVYMEGLTVENPDVRSFRIRPAPNRLPRVW